MVGWLEKAEIKPTQPSLSWSWAEVVKNNDLEPDMRKFEKFHRAKFPNNFSASKPFRKLSNLFII